MKLTEGASVHKVGIKLATASVRRFGINGIRFRSHALEGVGFINT